MSDQDEDNRVSIAIEAIKNAINVEVKARYGDQAFVHGSLISTLIEIPRKEGEGPEAQTMWTMQLSTDALPPKTQMEMIRDTALQIQNLRSESK